MIQPSFLHGLMALTCGAIITVPSAIAQSDQPDEWSRFRGRSGSGVGSAEGLPAKFSMSDFQWMIDLPGPGHSSPVLWGKKLFLTLVSDVDGSRQLVGIDAIVGKVLWSKGEAFEDHHQHNFNSFASSSPVVDAERVYVVWTSGDNTLATAFDHDGNQIWTREWPGFSSDHGSAASPILADGVLVFHTDSKNEKESLVVGLNPTDGETLWEHRRVTPVNHRKHLTAYSTPVTIKLDGQTVVVILSASEGWSGLAPHTGSVIFSHQGNYKYRSVSSIIASDGLVFATMGSGGAGKCGVALRVFPGDSSLKPLYELGIKDGLSYVPTPIIHEGLLYLWGDGGILTCRDVESGALVYKKRVGPGQFFSSPILADGKIYCGSRDGRVFVVKAGRKFQLLAENRLQGELDATPAIANNRMYIRTNSHLICLPCR